MSFEKDDDQLCRMTPEEAAHILEDPSWYPDDTVTEAKKWVGGVVIMKPTRRTVAKGLAALPVALALPAAVQNLPFRVRQGLALDLPGYLEHASPDLLVHSSGGKALDFFALQHLAKERSARVHIEGIAGGGAALLTALGDVSIHPGGLVHLMEHWVVTDGGPEELARAAARLEELDRLFSVVVAESSGVDVAQVRAWMAEDRWLDAEEALEAGLVNSIRERPQWA